MSSALSLSLNGRLSKARPHEPEPGFLGGRFRNAVCGRPLLACASRDSLPRFPFRLEKRHGKAQRIHRERLNRVKARKPKIKMRLNMTKKEQVLNALKGGAMTIDGLSAATGIGTGNLYAVCSFLDNAGEIVRESVDGGRTHQYRLASQAPYRPGEKFAVNLARGKAYILFTDASSFVNLLTGEEVHPTRAEMQNAVPLSIRHTVSLG